MNRREFIGSSAALALFGGTSRLFAEAALPWVPVYYNDFLAKIVAKVNRNRMQFGCDEGFIFITDPHVRSNHRQSGRLIARLLCETGLKRVLCGGDFPEAFGKGYSTDREALDFSIKAFREVWVDPIRAVGGKLYSAKGNHDFTVRHSYEPKDGVKGCTFSGLETKRIIIDQWTERGIVTNSAEPAACYYYFDVPSTKTRYIVADTTDTEEAGDIGWTVKGGMHEPQLQWLAGQAFATVPANYGVVVMHHIPVIDVAGVRAEHVLYTPMRELMEAYQNRGVYTCGGKKFNFAKAHGKILLDITGHQHGETQTWSKGILHLSEPCDAAYRDYDFRSVLCGSLPEKKKGTIYEQTFDVVQLDPKGRRIFVTRVGGGQDRVLHLDPIKMKVGETIKPRAQVMKEVHDWATYDGDHATSRPNPENRWNPLWTYKHDFGEVDASGKLVAKSPGIFMLLARDRNLAKEIFPVVSTSTKEKP